MIDDSEVHVRRQACADALAKSFAHYRVDINRDTEAAVFKDVEAFVDCLRLLGSPPEQIILAVRGVVERAGLAELDDTRRRHASIMGEARIGPVVSRAIRRYFEAQQPGEARG